MAGRDYENMSEKELLVELLKQQKGETRARRFVAVVMVLIFLSVAISLALIVPKIMGVAADVKGATEKLSNIVKTVESKLETLDSTVKDIDKMVKNVDDLVVSNTQNLSEAVEKLNAIEFDKLNKAINDFSDTVEPLANFFNAFKIP